jgi:hypothetical protein
METNNVTKEQSNNNKKPETGSQEQQHPTVGGCRAHIKETGKSCGEPPYPGWPVCFKHLSPDVQKRVIQYNQSIAEIKEAEKVNGPRIEVNSSRKEFTEKDAEKYVGWNPAQPFEVDKKDPKFRYRFASQKKIESGRLDPNFKIVPASDPETLPGRPDYGMGGFGDDKDHGVKRIGSSILVKMPEEVAKAKERYLLQYNKDRESQPEQEFNEMRDKMIRDAGIVEPKKKIYT